MPGSSETVTGIVPDGVKAVIRAIRTIISIGGSGSIQGAAGIVTGTECDIHDGIAQAAGAQLRCCPLLTKQQVKKEKQVCTDMNGQPVSFCRYEGTPISSPVFIPVQGGKHPDHRSLYKESAPQQESTLAGHSRALISCLRTAAIRYVPLLKRNTGINR